MEERSNKVRMGLVQVQADNDATNLGFSGEKFLNGFDATPAHAVAHRSVSYWRMSRANWASNFTGDVMSFILPAPIIDQCTPHETLGARCGRWRTV